MTHDRNGTYWSSKLLQMPMEMLAILQITQSSTIQFVKPDTLDYSNILDLLRAWLGRFFTEQNICYGLKDSENPLSKSTFHLFATPATQGILLVCSFIPHS